MKNIFLKSLLALILSISITLIYLFLPKVFFSLDNRLRDFMFITRGELPKSDQVIIIDIDEKSLDRYGQWPWSRDTISKLLKNLRDLNAGIIGLDIVFAEEDRSSPHRLALKFPEITTHLPNYDKILAKTLQTSPVVGGYIFTFDDSGDKEPPMIPAIFIERGLRDNHTIISPKSVILNTPMIQESLYSSGFFNNIPDESGMIRRVPLIMKYDQSIYASLPLEMVRIYSQANRVTISGDSIGVDEISFGEYTIPTDSFGRLFVNFRGAKRHFRYISALDILSGGVDSRDIKGKFILVGTSVLGLYDLRSISYDSNIPGVEIHANVIDNLLKGDFLYQPNNYILYDIIIIFSTVFLLMFILNFIASIWMIPSAIILLYLLYALFYTLLFEYGLVLNLLFPLVAFILALILSIGIDYTTAYRQKEEAKKMLGKKVSTAVMDYLLKHSDEDIVASREVYTTIFFSDIRDFTTISEKIGSPDRLIDMLNRYMTPMVDSIIYHQGTIDKFIGDAIMAYWNAPLEVDNHADMALKSAIEQLSILDSINEAIYPKYGINIDIGIGLHSGLVTAGDMGSHGRSDYTIIGDNVNIASRLEGLTKHYGVKLIISSSLYDILQERYTIRPLDIVEVKGKSQQVEIYEVIYGDISDDELSRYTNAIELFRDAKLESAYIEFKSLYESYPSNLYDIYTKRCRDFLDHPHIPFTAISKMI